MSLHLFLAHADTRAPVLADSLPPASTDEPPSPERTPDPPSHLANRSGHPDALPEQRWALIVPRGDTGKRLRSLVEPLTALRREQQAADVIVYEVDPGMDPEQANQWIARDYWDKVQRDEAELPRYLLLLGGPELISWDLQQMLGSQAFVGRLAFTTDHGGLDERGYEAYVDKVLRWERSPPIPRAPAIFHTVQDGTSAIFLGHERLMKPSVRTARERRKKGRFPAEEILETETPSELLERAERARGGLLFSMSHGIGVPATRPWRSAEEQRIEQGAMKLSAFGEPFTGRDMVAQKAFLPGGLWLYFACFGAGTPSRSVYFPWLDQLKSLGAIRMPAERVLSTLPRAGEPPFVAALPQRALAHPEGPLGVIGHVDLAWAWGFLDGIAGAPGQAPRGRHERFQGLLRSLVEGHRFGVAHNELAGFFNEVTRSLSGMYGQNAARGIVDEDKARKAAQAELWMQHHDLAAYVLLGDPAARLPIAELPVGVRLS
jgi:hypothetical protein